MTKLTPEMDQALGNASWLISYALALDDQGKKMAAQQTWLEAAAAEEVAVSVLEDAGEELEAGVHHASAAGCYQRAGRFAPAITHLRAALASSVAEPFKRRLRPQLKRCIQKASKEMQKVVRQRKKTAKSESAQALAAR